MKKIVNLDHRAKKEISSFPVQVRLKIAAVLEILERDGFLREPYAKKLDTELFEIRIKSNGQWRLLYAYFTKQEILILSAFHKKTQKTPLLELSKAKKRLKEHLKGLL